MIRYMDILPVQAIRVFQDQHRSKYYACSLPC